jgi:chloramphenicol 3-O-phosphotransferase
MRILLACPFAFVAVAAHALASARMIRQSHRVVGCNRADTERASAPLIGFPRMDKHN